MGTSSSHISGGHGDKAHNSRGVLYRAKSLTSTRMLPPLQRRTVDTGPEAVENKSPPPRAHVRHHTEEVSVWAFSASDCRMQCPSTAKEWKKFGAPTHPTVAPGPQEEGWWALSTVERESQCSGTTTLS